MGEAPAMPVTGGRWGSKRNCSDRELPYIDEHTLEIAAEPHLVWQALLATLPRAFGAPRGLAAVLGCRERRRHGDLHEPGATLVGFRVLHTRHASELTLVGRHRFSRYALFFAIDDLGAGRSHLGAITRAAFPGPHGRAYRALVIGSGLHVRAVREILAAVSSRATGPCFS